MQINSVRFLGFLFVIVTYASISATLKAEPVACQNPCFTGRGVLCNRKSGETCPPCVTAQSGASGKFNCADTINGVCASGWTDCSANSSPSTAPSQVPNSVSPAVPSSISPSVSNPQSVTTVPSIKTSENGNTPQSSPTTDNSTPTLSTTTKSPRPWKKIILEDETGTDVPVSEQKKEGSGNEEGNSKILTTFSPEMNNAQSTSDGVNTETWSPEAQPIDGSISAEVVNTESNSTLNSKFTLVVISSLLGVCSAIVVGCIVGYYVFVVRKHKESMENNHDTVFQITLSDGIQEPTTMESAYTYSDAYSCSSVATTINTQSTVIGTHSVQANQTSSKASSSSSTVNVASYFTALQLYRLNVEEIQDIKPIGAGGFAVVWLVQHHNTLLASKRLHVGKNFLHSISHHLEKFAKEIEIVSKLRHMNIVSFVGVAWDDSDNLQVLLEYMEGGDLRDSLTRKEGGIILQRGWNTQKFKIAHDIAAALLYVHSFRPALLHRDLKSRNILLNADGSLAKLGDFGVSRSIALHSKSQSTMTPGVGTTRWLAPEVLTGARTYDASSDMYSFGMVLLEMDTHDVPFFDLVGRDGRPIEEPTLVFRMATEDLRPIKYFSENCDTRILDLARRCLQRNPKDRPTALELSSELRQLI